jgi:hypothetical protein
LVDLDKRLGTDDLNVLDICTQNDVTPSALAAFIIEDIQESLKKESNGSQTKDQEAAAELQRQQWESGGWH